MECRKRAENLINRKIGTFYIETVPQKISQLRKKNRVQKISEKKIGQQNFVFFSKKNLNIFEHLKIRKIKILNFSKF